MKSLSLNEIQNYRNESILLDFHIKNPAVSFKQTQEYFNDLLAWMWLNHYRKSLHKKTWMFGPLLALDNIWHTFILHTKDYHTFCHNYFGEYFHHDVEPPNQPHILTPDELADFLEDCFAFLGEAWVDRYFGQLYA